MLRTVANATRRDGTEFLELAAKIPIRAETQPFPLADVNHALQLLKHSQINGSAVLEMRAGNGSAGEASLAP